VRSLALAGVVFLIGGAAALACSSFGEDGGGTPSGTDAGGDAATTDGTTTDSADGGPTNLLANGDFENGCYLWAPFEANLNSTPSGRDGGTACRVCTNHAATVLFSVTQSPGGAPAPGSTYRAEVWVRGVPLPVSTGGNSVGDTAYATFRTRDDAGVTNVEYIEQGLALKGDWQKVAVKLPVAKAAATIDFYVFIGREGGAPNNTCFDVDDATVFKTP
jgi:hypothetical protein